MANRYYTKPWWVNRALRSSPWPKAAKGTRLQAHPFLRKGKAMFA